MGPDVEDYGQDKAAAGLTDNSDLLCEDGWDIKSIKISLGGLDDANGFVKAEIFDDMYLGIYKNPNSEGGCDAFIESIPIDAAKRIRDFLIYALEDT